MLLLSCCSSAAEGPEEGSPEPQEIRQVIHRDEESRPPTHLVWPHNGQLQAAPALDELQQLREQEDQDEEENQTDNPDRELESHGHKRVEQIWMSLVVVVVGNIP